MDYACYRELVSDIINNGYDVDTRNEGSVGTLQIESTQLTFVDFLKDEPILSDRHINAKGAFAELRWILAGSRESTLETILHPHKVHWWDDYLPLNYVYGQQFYQTDQQLMTFIDNVRKEPHSRRHILSFWNHNQTANMSLPPCITNIQLLINKGNEGTLIVTQRSADVILGLPYDILEMQLLHVLLGYICSYTPVLLVFNIGSAHIYMEHTSTARKLTKPANDYLHDILVNTEFGDYLKRAELATVYKYLYTGKYADMFNFTNYYELDLPKYEIKMFK